MLLRKATFEALCRAREALWEIEERPPSISELAQRIELSPFHFIRQFEAVFGVTPHQFRINRRLERAKSLLDAGELSVTEICMEVGFSSLGSFSDLFRRRVGVAPSTYRRRARERIFVPDRVTRAAALGCFDLMSLLPPTAFRNFREA